MFSMDLTSREGDGRMVVALRGKLDVSEAAGVAAGLAAAAIPARLIVMDLASLEFIDATACVADAASHAERSLATRPAAGHPDPLATGRCAVLTSG